MFIVAALAFATPITTHALSTAFTWGDTSIEDEGVYTFPINESRAYTIASPEFGIRGEVYVVDENAQRTQVGSVTFFGGDLAWPQAGEYEIDFYMPPSPIFMQSLRQRLLGVVFPVVHAQSMEFTYLETLHFTVEPLVMNQPPTITNLIQRRAFGGEIVPSGTTFVGNEITFEADITDPDGDEVWLEVELNPTSTTTGTRIVRSATSTSGTVTFTAEDIITKDELYEPGGNTESFNIRMRAVDSAGNDSGWYAVGESGVIDFTIKVVPLWTQVVSEYPVRSPFKEWADEDYADGRGNRADDPTGSCGQSIAKCGCGIASAIMLGDYHGATQNVDGGAIDPLTFDQYLLAYDGYDAYGNIIGWSSVVSNYFGERDAFGNIWLHMVINDGYTFSQTLIDQQLAQAAPVLNRDIAHGHFFVLADKVGSTYTVRDPLWYETQTLNGAKQRDTKGNLVAQAYHNVFTKARIVDYYPELVASRSDLTFILMSPAELVVTAPSGARVGTDPRTGETYTEITGASYECEYNIVSSEDVIDESDLHCTRVLRVPEPEEGTYAVQVIGTGEGEYNLSSRTLNTRGETHTSSSEGVIAAGGVDTYALTYATDTEADLTSVFTVAELLTDIKTVIREADMRRAFKVGLLAKVRVLERMHERGNSRVANRLTQVLIKTVKHLKRRDRMPADTADELLLLLRELKSKL